MRLAALMVIPVALLSCGGADESATVPVSSVCDGTEALKLAVLAVPTAYPFDHDNLNLIIDGTCRYWLPTEPRPGPWLVVQTGTLDDTTAASLLRDFRFTRWPDLAGEYPGAAGVFDAGSILLTNGADVITCHAGCSTPRTPALVRQALDGFNRWYERLQRRSVPVSAGSLHVKLVDVRGKTDVRLKPINAVEWPFEWPPEDIAVPLGDPRAGAPTAGRVFDDPSTVAVFEMLRDAYQRGTWPATGHIPIRRRGVDLPPTRFEFELYIRDVTPYEDPQTGGIPVRW